MTEKQPFSPMNIQDPKNTKTINQLADFYKVISDPTRLKLLILLEKEPLCSGDMAEQMQMTRSAISHQLKILKSNKLVKTHKEGKTILYSLDDEHIHSILEVALEHILEE